MGPFTCSADSFWNHLLKQLNLEAHYHHLRCFIKILISVLALKNSDLIIQIGSQASVRLSSPSDYHMKPGKKTMTLKNQSVFVNIKASNVFC